jgi:hypothetical protein
MKARGVKVARPIDWRLVLTNSVRGVGVGLGLGWVRLGCWLQLGRPVFRVVSLNSVGFSWL